MQIPKLPKIPEIGIPTAVKSLSRLELILFIIFVLYLVLPIDTPQLLADIIDSPLGMLFIFILGVYLFFNTNPILAVVYILFAYELLRRSSRKTGRQAIIQYTPSQQKKDAQMKAMNPPKKETLEEEVVDKMAPIGHSDPSVFTDSGFKPVADPVGHASLY
jgi:hypothetical protein